MHKLKPYGPRGVILLALAVVAFGRAVAYLIPGQPSFVPAILVEISDVIPLTLWGVLWGATGLVLTWYAPREKQDIGLLAMIPMSTAWALVYLYAAITRVAEAGFLHSIGAFITASVYIALAVVVVALTRLINLPRHKEAASE